MSRKGSWISTYSGKLFWPLDPKPEEICIEDIAHALSLMCRFGGHCKEFYSVAQHSVIGANYLCQQSLTFEAKQFLLHDAAEAYLCDLSRPIKANSKLGELYKEIEHKLEQVIAGKFNLPYPPSELVKETDNRMLLTERRDLLADQESVWSITQAYFPCFVDKISPWNSYKAEQLFLSLFTQLDTSCKVA